MALSTSFDMLESSNTMYEVIKMANKIHFSELPLGLGMALAQNTEAMYRFCQMDEQQQREIISHTKQIQSRQEMREFVRSFAE